MDPKAFLDIANQLQTSAAEAGRRTSIGRSYYALYNLLRVALASQGILFHNRGDDHGRLVYYLTRCGNQAIVRIGQALRDLRLQRNDADYEMSTTIDANQSQLAYQRAKNAADRLDALSAVDMAAIILRIKALPPFSPRPPRV